MTVGLVSYYRAVCEIDTAYRVRSVGEFLLHNRECGTEKIADFPEILWCVDGAGKVSLDGVEYSLLPEQVFYYPQGAHHLIQCAGKRFGYRWLSMEGPGAAVLFDGLRLRPGVNKACPCPVELFRTVAEKIWISSPFAQLDALGDAVRILTKVAAGVPKKTEGLIEKAMEIIELNFHDPELNVEKVAALLATHRVTLSRAFMRSKKISVIDYLKSRRFREAMYLLQHTQESVQQIAVQCGYANSNYFTKDIRQRTGLSPSRLRGGASST